MSAREDPPAIPALSPAAVEALVLDTTPWLSCEECFERLDTYAEAAEALLHDAADGSAVPRGDLAMERHLRGCAACDEEARSLIALLLEDADGQ